MSKIYLLPFLLFFAISTAKAQEPVKPVKDSTVTTAPAQVDTLKSTYVNPGKIAGRRAAIRSAIIPGMGQIGNGVTVYRLAKVAAIYTGATLLTISYMDNNRQYKRYLKELQYRATNGDQPDPNGEFTDYPNTTTLAGAKDTYSRNLWIIRFSYGALYAVNIIEAYVDARLKYFDVGNDLSLKISPSFNNGMNMYGYAPVAPGFKLTLKL